MNFSDRKKSRSNERGQILPMFVIMLPILLLFVGLTMDFGMAYVTKTALSKAADAAALAAMRNIKKGQAEATILATAAFNANYGAFGGNAAPPTVNVSITTNSTNNTVVNVTATTALNSMFLSILPGYKTINVSSASQTTRPKLIMSMVLDKSGSMNKNGGSTALAPAVVNFLSYFDDTSDQVADVSFSSASNVDVQIENNFTTPITDAVNKMAFGGYTFTQVGLQDGMNQITSVNVPSGEIVVKAIVFFTDGWANTIQDTMSCPASTVLNLGGCAPPEYNAGWCKPSVVPMSDPSTGNGVSCSATTFFSQAANGNMPLTPVLTGLTNVSNDAMYRANLVATSARAQNIVVYSIGLGNKISSTFLQEIANDPASDTYDPTQPVGEAVFAPTAAELQGVFQEIANKILLRISQ